MENRIFTFDEYVINESKKKNGLWDNIRAKRKAGKKASHPNSKAYKDAVKAGKEINEVEDINESSGIPDRYKKKGYNKVGVKKINRGSGNNKWSVLARKKVGGKMKYRIIKGGYKGMSDYTKHKDPKRRKRFWDRMGGKNSSKAKDPFSALYWHKRFGTW